MPINKFTTLLDLARQAKIISGETATFDGKIQAGIPFSEYPTGVDTGTTVSLGIVSSEDAVFSGNTGTTIFDVSNTGSTNYSPIFSGYTASTWTNPLFSGNTSGLTLPITPLSADTQIVGPFWTLTQTGMTGDYVIGTQYTGYSVTYSFFNVSQFGTGFTYSGFTTASQENFSAGTLDYKGPLDYISTKEDASVEGRLTTNKITITNGASASTVGYVLTQTGENGEAEWVINSSADTNTYVTGGTLTLPSAGSNLILGWNTGGSANPIDLSSLKFTGNTSGDCISDIFVSNIHSCSPLYINPLDEGNVYFGSGSGFTIDVLNGGNVYVKGDLILHSDNDTIDDFPILSNIFRGTLTSFDDSLNVGTVVTNPNPSGTTGMFFGDFSNFPTKNPNGSLGYYGTGYTRSGILPPTGLDFYRNKVVLLASNDTDGMVIKAKAGDPTGKLWFEIDGNCTGIMNSSSGYWGFGLNPDGTELPTVHLQVGGTGTTGTFKFLDGNQQSGYVMTSDANGNVSWQTPTTFTGNTSGDCITDLYVRRLYGCSPITVHDTITYNGSIIDSATTNSFIFGSNHVLTASSLTHGSQADANVILGGSDNRITPNSTGFYNTIIGGYGNEINARINYASIIGATNSNISSSNLAPTTIIGGNSNTILGSKSSVIIGGEGNFIDRSDRTIILGGSGITGTTDDTVYTPDLNVSGDILVENTSGKFFTDIENSSGTLVILSSKTDTDIHRISVKTPNSDSISMGVRGSSDVSYPGYGNQGDSFIYSSNPNNGINIISSQGTGTDDYIRFYAGQNANGTTPDLYIQGSGTTRGYVGINTDSPTNHLDINNQVGYKGFRIRRSYTPSSSGDTNGEVGTITWDNNYIYVKTSGGWGRAQLDFAF